MVRIFCGFMVVFCLFLAAVTAFTSCAAWQKLEQDPRCVATCVVIDALECWDSPDMSTVVTATSQFIDCSTACSADPSFSAEIDPSCVLNPPKSCEDFAACVRLGAVSW